jgi:hypothetical protein
MFDARIYIEHIKLLDYLSLLKQHLHGDFVTILTFVAIVAFGAIMTFINILRLPNPCKWPITFHDSNK